MRRCLFLCSLLLVSTASVAAPKAAATLAAVKPAEEQPLLEVKADPKSGKIIATLTKHDADGFSGR
jgi:hypothetical protein